MFIGYFDESGTHAGSPIVCVAGLIATDRQWKEHEREWLDVLKEAGITFFHMAKFESRYEEYKDWDNDRRIKIQTRFIDIIKRRINVGIATAVSIPDYEAVVTGHHRDLLGNPYAFCSRLCLNAIDEWADKYNRNTPISLIFEDGAAHKREFARLFNVALEGEESEEVKRLCSLEFLDKRTVLPLQAADIWVYEIYKRACHRINDRERPMRVSFQKLGSVPLFGRIYFEKELREVIGIIDRRIESA